MSIFYTEEQIERAVEHKFDVLETRLFAGRVSKAQYDYASQLINNWKKDQYQILNMVRQNVR